MPPCSAGTAASALGTWWPSMAIAVGGGWWCLLLPPQCWWGRRGSVCLIYVTAAAFGCCHSHIPRKIRCSKRCYTSIAYARGKTITIYIYKKATLVKKKKDLEQDYQTASSSCPQTCQCNASLSPPFRNTSLVKNPFCQHWFIDLYIYLFCPIRLSPNEPNICFY